MPSAIFVDPRIARNHRIPDQKRAIERYAQEQGFKILRFYTDDAISGTSTVGRHAFQAMIADAKRKSCQFHHVMVYDVKRFGRIDNDEAGYYRHILRQHHVEVLYVTEGFDGSGTDDLLRPVKQWQAREESKDLSKVTIRGLLTKSQTGFWMGGVPPYGYDLCYETYSGGFLMHVRYLPDGSKQLFDETGKPLRTIARGESLAVSRRDRCRLVLGDQSRVSVVREIFRLYVDERRGYRALADTLNRKGIPSPRGPEWSKRHSGRWSVSTCRAILVNPAYAGDLAWNRRTDARFHRINGGHAVERSQADARRLEPNDESDWIVVRDAHPAIVSRRVWEIAHRLREEQEASKLQRGINPRTGERAGAATSAGGWTGPRAKFLLSGLMSCAQCGSRYEGHSQYRKGFDDNGRCRRTLGYACGGYIRHGRHVCEIGRIDKGMLERSVIEAVVEYYGPLTGEQAEQRIGEALQEQIGGDLQQVAKTQARIKSRLRTIDKKIRNMLDNITATNRELIDTRIGELSPERERLEAKLESLAHLAFSRDEQDEAIAETRRFVASLPSLLTERPLEDRRAAIRRCVDRIVVDRANHTLTIELRRVPAVAGGSLAPDTEKVLVALNGAWPERRA